MANPKEWTLMFYFASDNPLAPGIVSQLKAIQNAGFHPDVNVIAYFDPEPAGTPAHIFDVNLIKKLEGPDPNIGFDSNDPFVRNLMLDKLWGDELSRDGKTAIRDLIKQLMVDPKVNYDPPKPPVCESTAPPPGANVGAQPDDINEPAPKDSLRTFLNFCASEYQAAHYMLFILGHGLVVGSDVFLQDDHAISHSVTLRELGGVLEEFKRAIGDGSFELVSFHSCSMSSLEVAYELEGTAKFMLASQGPAFVGSWPYRQILIRIFNDVKAGGLKTPQEIQETLERIFFYVLHNSTDYILAGYSFDLSLYNLGIITDVRKPIQDLADALRQGLRDQMVKNCIQLAHLKSQSYWQESYTDIYDFCFCLRGYCEEFSVATGNNGLYEPLKDKCQKVMDALEKSPGQPLLLAEYAGPDSQYSHGFSIYFPWTRPTEDQAIMQEYEHYKFNSTGWFDFLQQYWGPQNGALIEHSTMRPSCKDEQAAMGRVEASNPYNDLLEDIASLMFNSEGSLNTNGTLADPPPKTHPNDPTGDSCTCASIKNYLRDTRARRQRGKSASPSMPFSSKASHFIS